MKLRHLLQITAATVAIIAASIGVNMYRQYRTAHPPALDSMPVYTSAIPITDVLEPQRTDAETQMRNLAATAQPGYRIAEERFLGTSTRLVWDALRHHVESYLGTGYKLARERLSADYTIIYEGYRRLGLRQRFDNDVIAVVGCDRTPLKTVTGDEVYLYGYFRLTPG
jgi:hypothetical protein